MKFLILLAFLVMVSMAGVTGQRSRCPQINGSATCVGDRDVGTSCPTRPPRRLWYYNQANRTCDAMDHLGCGGNSNRWCTRLDCEFRCNRPLTAG